MIYIIISAIFAGFVFWKTQYESSVRGNGDIFSIRTTYRFWGFVPLLIILFLSVGFTGDAINKNNNINNSLYYLEELTSQRDQLLLVFDEVLDNEDFVRLMEASVPQDVVFLKSNPQVTSFLLSRADNIVAVNQRLFEQRNLLLEDAKDVCNYVQNPLTFKLPLFVPDCQLGTILEMTNPKE